MYLSLRSIPIWQISNIPNLQLDKSMPDTLNDNTQLCKE